MAHAAEHRLFHDLGAVAPQRALEEILAETLVAQNETDFRVPACDERAMLGEVNGIGGAQPLIGRIGIANELRREGIEQRIADRSLNMLVHGNLRLATEKPTRQLDAFLYRVAF